MKILVVYYSQTGQLRNILDSIASGISKENDVEVNFAEIKMKVPYPFPWKPVEFFDTFPETLQEIPQEIIPPKVDTSKNYDLILLGYQTWYMSPCIPIMSFLKSKQAESILNQKPVVTVIGARNMWLVGQEKMKRHLLNVKANLVGNIALVDKTPNLVGILTILGWMLKGKKKNFLGFLPPSGVSEKDISDASRFGTIIYSHVKDNSIENLHSSLLSENSMEVVPKLLLLEKRANRLFGLWSKFMLSKGGPGNPKRQNRARILLFLIPLGALILAPLSALIALLSAIFMSKKFKTIKDRYTLLQPVGNF